MLEEYNNKELIAELIARGAYDIDNEGQAIIYTGVTPDA
jgi:hypothetical protein